MLAANSFIDAILLHLISIFENIGAIMLRFIFLFKITKAFHLINQTYELFYVSSNELLT